jgi:hypothetical protein
MGVEWAILSEKFQHYFRKNGGKMSWYDNGDEEKEPPMTRGT